MESFKKEFLNAIKSSFTGEKYCFSDSFDLESAFKLAKAHSVIPIFYYGLLNSNISGDNKYMQEMFTITCNNIVVSEQQLFELDNLFTAFDEKKIEYLPLKGSILKRMYPKSEMRTMGDADILIKVNQYETIKEIVKNLGFTEYVESDHELIWNKKTLHLELHKRLIPSYNKDYYSYFGDGWKLAKMCDGTRYRMTDEDEMIYLFTHFAKHYRDAGIGIKHMVDLWVYRNNKSNLNEDYIISELKKLQLDVFYNNIKHTLSVWFEGEKDTDMSDFITDVIFSSGTYGTHTAAVISSALKTNKSTGSASKTRFKKAINIMFPPYSVIKIKYKWLNKKPYLLPAAWLIRGIKALVLRPKKVINQADNMKFITSKNINDYESALDFVGLDFNFKE